MAKAEIREFLENHYICEFLDDSEGTISFTELGDEISGTNQVVFKAKVKIRGSRISAECPINADRPRTKVQIKWLHDLDMSIEKSLENESQMVLKLSFDTNKSSITASFSTFFNEVILLHDLENEED